MDWDLAIKLNRDALLRLLALWVASVGRFASDGPVTKLPRYVRGNILRLLRPAESAARRLIVAVARELPDQPHRPRPAPKAPIPRGKGERIPAFRLIDPRKRFDLRPRSKGPGPRVWVIGYDDSHLPLCARQPRTPERKTPPPPAPDDPVSADPLRRRLQALRCALDDLPRQARRLARLRARRLPPLRPGRPPGYRRRPLHEVDEVLRECHSLARYALEPPDTS